MYSLMISIGGAIAVDATFWLGLDSPWWGLTLAFLTFFALQAAIGIKMKNRVQQVMTRVQGILAEGQKRLQTKMARWRIRPPGSMKDAQREIERDQRLFVKEALEATEDLRAFKRWIPLMERQIATAQFQLYWMLKDFAKVDELLPKAIFADGSSRAMRLARMFATGAGTEEMAKFHKKGSRRARYNENVLFDATWSWILVKKGDLDGAFRYLTEALKNSDNAVLKANHIALMNNRPTHFSNAGLGDQWYALFLEEPKIRRERPRMQWR